MVPLTLTATTRRVATGKGNFSKDDAVNGKQFPPPSGAQLLSSSARSTVAHDVNALQRRVRGYLDAWYRDEGDGGLDFKTNPDYWTNITDLADKTYDPVFAAMHEPSTLCDSASMAAATFAALGTAIEEKLKILCGENVLKRAAEFSSESSNITDVILSNDTVSDMVSERLNEWNDVMRDETLIFNRRDRLMTAPLPHRYSLFEKFGGCSETASAAGTTNASDMHGKLVNHVFKVAFRKTGPRGTAAAQSRSLQALQETHAVSRHILEHFNGSLSQNQQNTSVFYCDYYDYEAYQLLPERMKRSSVVPGSYNMHDLPFRPFAVPSSYRDGGQFFKYDRAVPLDNTPAVAFDYGEFLCYCIFGLEWDKHLGDVVDALAHSPMNKFQKAPLEGVYIDTNDYNRLGKTRTGVADLALRSLAEFIRAEAHEAASSAEDDAAASNLKLVIKRAVVDIKLFLDTSLPQIINRFKLELPQGDYGEEGEFECLVAHLFLSRLSDESHVLRNADIQRTVHSTQINLQRRQLTAQPENTKVQTYANFSDVPVEVIDGLSGTSTATHDKGFYGNAAVVSWDGSSRRVVGVWRNMTIRPDKELLTEYEDQVKLADVVKGVLQEISEHGGLNPVFFNRANLYRALEARGIFAPGLNLTEDGRTFAGKENDMFDTRVPLVGRIALGGEFRGFFSGVRDILETKAITTLSRDGFSSAIKTEASALRASEGLESGVVNSFSAAYTRDPTIGLEFAEDTNAIVIKSSNKSLLEETKALRANERAFSSVMKDMGVEVSEEADAIFASEMRETYPDAAINEWRDAVEDFQKSVPESQIEKLEEIERGASLEGMSEKINHTELAKATDVVVGKKLGNGFSMFMGRFGATVIIGSVVIGGFLGPAAYGMMHASRGAHLNVVNHTSKPGVITYKMVDFSCEDKTLGWAKRAEHPFREEIDEVIVNNADFKTPGGAYVNDNGKKSRYKAHAPICGEYDAKVSSCGAWTTFDEPHSVLAWVPGAEMSALEKGSSITCEKGMTAVQAVVNSILLLGADVADKIFEVLEDAVVGIAERTFSAIINSPALIVGVPLAVGIAATRLQMSNWKTGLVAAAATLVLILVVRFFAGSGAFTLNRFKKRKTTEATGHNFKRRKLVDDNKSGDEQWRPSFLPATTNYTRAARIIGRDVPHFSDCYKSFAMKPEEVMRDTSQRVATFAMDSSGAFSPLATANESVIRVADVDPAGVLDNVSLVLDASIPAKGPAAIRTELATVLGEQGSPGLFVIRGNTQMPASIDPVTVSSVLERTAIVSVNRAPGEPLRVDVYNTHTADKLHLQIIPGEEEFNSVPEPTVITVDPRTTSSGTPVSSNGEGRRLHVTCSWGEHAPSASYIPTGYIYEVAKKQSEAPHLRELRDNIIRVLDTAVVKKLEHSYRDDMTYKSTVHLLHCIAATAGFMKMSGLPTRRITDTKFLSDCLAAFADTFDVNDFLFWGKSGEDVEIMDHGENAVELIDTGAAAASKFNKDVITLLTKHVSDQNLDLLDMAVSLGVFYYAPVVAKNNIQFGPVL